MQITAITPQKFRKNFYNIFIDNQFSLSLNGDEIVKSKLKVGSELSPEQIENFKKLTKEINLNDRLYRFLSFRPRSEQEVKNYFKRKKTSPEEVKKILEKGKSLGLIDDVVFTKWWIENRQAFHPVGSRLLEHELKQKGISQDLIKQEMGENSSKTQSLDYQNALKIAETKLPRYLKLPQRDQREKTISLLARRGFDWDTIESVVDSLFQKE